MRYIAVVLTALFSLTFIHTAKLNVPKVLLPLHSTVRAKFLLEASEGCFEWTSSNPAIVGLENVNTSSNPCSRAVFVSALVNTPTKFNAVVRGRGFGTNQILRADITLDKIHSLKIDHTTTELFLEDAPELFVVRALDSEENTFSTLDGIPFEWSIIAEDCFSGLHVSAFNKALRLVRLKDSFYEVPPAISFLESKGVYGNKILVEGIRTGVAFVQAKLMDPMYPDMYAPSVQLLVRAKVIISPFTDVYLLPKTSVPFKLFLSKHDQFVELQPPQEDYFLTVSNTTVAELDNHSLTLTALTYGTCEVCVVDNIASVIASSFRPVCSSVHVVEPAYLSITIHNSKSWILELKKVYTVSVQLLAENNMPVYLSNNLFIHVSFPKDYIERLSFSQNGSHGLIHPVAVGKATINAELLLLHYDATVKRSPFKLSVSQSVRIVPSLCVSPKLLVFSAPSANLQYNVQMQALGGTNLYSWRSSNRRVSEIDEGGLLRITGVGYSQISLTDVNSDYMHDEARVYALNPVSLRIFACPVETIYPQVLTMHVAMTGLHDEETLNMNYCHLLKFNVTLTNDVFSFESVTASNHNFSCALLHFRPYKYGLTRVSVSVEDFPLEDQIDIISYLQFSTANPQLLLTPDSSYTVGIKNGLRSFATSRKQKIIENVTVSDHSLLQSAKLTDIENEDAADHSDMYRLKCLKLGFVIFTVSRQTEKYSSNTCPLQMTAEILITCADPTDIQIVPRTSDAIRSHCPLFVSHVPCLRMSNLTMDIVAFGANGNVFDNFTIPIKWSLSNPSVGIIKPISDKSAILYPSNICGEVKVLATTQDKAIIAHLFVHIVEPIHFQKSSIAIFNHSRSNEPLTIHGGSGKFAVSLDIANSISYELSANVLLIQPLAIGKTVLTAKDVCLGGEASIDVFVSTVHSVEILVVDKVQVGEEAKLYVNLIDNFGNIFMSNYTDHINVTVYESNSLLSFRMETPSEKSSALFVMRGNSDGLTLVHALCTLHTGEVVRSNEVIINVFKPMKLYPDNIVLMEKSCVQLEVIDGPRDCLSFYYSVSSTAASVSSSGWLCGLTRAVTEVILLCTSRVPFEQKPVIISKAVQNLTVVALTSINIFVPTSRILIGGKVPLTVFANNFALSPQGFASLLDRLNFKWEISNPSLAVILPVFGDVKVQFQSFSVVLLAKAHGDVTVSVTVSSKEYQIIPRIYHHSIKISITETLALQKSHLNFHHILMTPLSTFKLELKPTSDKLNFTVDFESGCKHCVELNNAGEILALNQTGDALVSVHSTAHSDIIQTIMVFVEIRPISYFLFSCTSPYSSRLSSLQSLPVGFAVSPSINFFDAVGRKFDSVNSLLRYSSSKTDLFSLSKVSDYSFTLTGIRHGSCVLKISSRFISDIHYYVPVFVEEAIYPSLSSVKVGDVVLFTPKIIFNASEGYHWSSNDFFSIHHSSGVAVALSAGHSIIELIIEKEYISSIEVPVIQVKEIQFLNRIVKYITNSPDDKSYVLATNLGNYHPSNTAYLSDLGNVSELSQYLEALKAPITCSLAYFAHGDDVDVEKLFTSTPYFDFSTGVWFCKLTQTNFTAFHKLVSRNDLEIGIKVCLQSEPSVSSAIKIPFYPSFYVHTKELHLSEKRSSGEIQISASKTVIHKIKVKSEDPSVLKVEKPRYENEDYIFTVALKHGTRELHSTAASVEISCSMYDYSVKVPVTIQLDEKKEHMKAAIIEGFFVKYIPLSIALLASVISGFLVYFSFATRGVVSSTDSPQKDRSYNITNGSFSRDKDKSLLDSTRMYSHTLIPHYPSQFSSLRHSSPIYRKNYFR